jgi:DNA repair protein RadA/Sms
MAITTKLSDLIFGTPISAITVPDHLNRTVATGVDFVDSAMGGQGFTPSSVTLFTGEPGAGKTTMVLTVASAIAKRKDAICIFNTAEESLFQIKKTVNRLGVTGDFSCGNSTEVDDVIAGCQKMMDANPNKQMFIVVDSLQQMNGTHSKYGRGYRSDSLVLEKILSFCKETHAIALIINQVNKSGTAAGSNKLKHMVDAHMHLGVERKDQDFMGMRVLQTQKNRFGGCGHVFFLDLGQRGFSEVARVSAS